VRPTCSRALAAILTLALAGCTASHKLDERERALGIAPDDVVWVPARTEDVVGYFESERVTGEAAANVRRLYYDFAADRTYSGAALVQDAGRASFQTLTGRWGLEGSALRLGDDPPAKAFAAPDRLRLDSEGGSVVLRRAKSD
jgi:hypothetical protein